MEEKLLLTSSDIEKIIEDNSKKIYEDLSGIEKFAVTGIQTRGVGLANRIKNNIERLSGKEVQSGALDITFYRDDLATRGILPVIKETRIDFNIAQMTIILVDDVLFTGRTVKAALETLTGFGRPQAIRLFTLVDRCNRELPIQPDYCGYRIETDIKDEIRVILNEIDGKEDSVYLLKN